MKYIMKNGELLWGDKERLSYGTIVLPAAIRRDDAPAFLHRDGSSCWYVSPAPVISSIRGWLLAVGGGSHIPNRIDPVALSFLRSRPWEGGVLL